jgi:hypothetical protein
MIPDGVTFLACELPFQIPCPPPALRLPPPVYRMSPEIQRNALNPIPSPPLGARVPGDRIKWSPLVFPESVAHHATFPSLKTISLSEANDRIANVESIEDAPGGVPERLVESVESDSIITCEDDALEDFPPADSSEVWQSDFMIGHSVQEIATDETAAPDAGSKPLARKGKTLPQTELLLPMICLDDDPVSVADLTKKLELKTCK